MSVILITGCTVKRTPICCVTGGEFIAFNLAAFELKYTYVEVENMVAPGLPYWKATNP